MAAEMRDTMDKKHLFELDDWLPRFPLEEMREGALYNPRGPGRICYVEQIRRRAAAVGELGRAVPCDVFVLGLGESSRRDTTKIGGLPYRPADLGWPVSERGEELAFLAQFRFTESADLLPALPGAVLLVFADRLFFYPYDDFASALHFEWYPLGLKRLTRPEGLPLEAMRERFGGRAIWHGYRHRTFDLIERTAVDAISRVIPREFDLLRDRDLCTPGEYDRYVDAEFCRLTQMKIGGAPFWRFPDDVERRHVEAGRFLCSLPQVFGNNEGAFPWVNRKRKRADFPSLRSMCFELDGVLHFFLDENGTVHPRFECFSIHDIVPE